MLTMVIGYKKVH